MYMKQSNKKSDLKNDLRTAAGSEQAPQGPSSASPGNSGPSSTAAKSLMALFVGLALASLPTFF